MYYVFKFETEILIEAENRDEAYEKLNEENYIDRCDYETEISEHTHNPWEE